MGYYYFPYSGLVNSITALILGYFILSKNPKSQTHRGYLFFASSVFLWSFAYFVWLMSKEKESALFFVRITMIGAILIPATYGYFVSKLLEQSRKPMNILNFFLALIFILFSFSPFYIKTVEERLFFSFWPVPGVIFHLMLIYFLTHVMYISYIIWQKMRVSNGVQKVQLKYVLVGTVIGYCGGCTNYLLWYNIGIPPVLNIFVTGFVICVAYAIIRHQLLDIEVIIKKTLVFAGLFTAIYAIFAGFTFLGQVVFEQITGGNRWISLIPSIVVIIFILRPLDNLLIGITDKYLFQKKYDYKQLLKTFTNEVLMVLDIDKLVKLTVDTLANVMKIEACGILLLNDEKNEFRLAAGIGINKKETIFDMSNTLIAFLGRTKLYLSIKDQGENSRIPDKIMHGMNRLKLELAIPLIIHDEMIGILTLGKKKSDESYTEDDMDILLPLARTLSIAINNAEMFEELGKTQAEAAQREKMAVIGTLAAGINHEICNPLGIARGQCEVYLLNSNEGLYNDRSTEEQIFEAKQIMQKVIKETDRATDITKKLSSFARPGSGEAKEDVSISHEIDEVMALIGHDLKLENIHFTKDIPDDLPNIHADKKQIQEIFFNLIRNAGQAIEETGKITVRARKINNSITVAIIDTGHGIANDKLEQIFNPFYTTKAPGKGTGLGLFIVRQIVRRNKGSISAKSKVGEGTTFTLEFELPQGTA